MKTISVTAPLGLAMSRVKTVLFQPFDLGKWFAIGFCAWLAFLTDAGGGGGNFGNRHGGRSGSAREALDDVREYIVSNIAWLAPLVIAVVVVALIIWVALLWVSSRGKFMFLHNVARNSSDIAGPWRTFAREAQSLFFFRLLLGLASFVVFLPTVTGLAIVILRMIYYERASVGGVLAAIVLVLGLIVLALLFWLIGRLLEDLVVPIQYARRLRCTEAWRELRSLSSGNIGNLVVYLLFRIVLGIGVSVVVVMAVLVTCCILGCLMLIPYLGTVLLLPILVLVRAYSMYYLAQYGPEFDCFNVPVANAERA